MFTTGSKLFFGLTAAAVAGFLVYGFFQEWGALGVVGLASAAVVLAFFAGVSLATRDSTVSAMDDAAIATSAAAQPAPHRSLWPLVGAAGGALLVIGAVTDQRWFVAGIAALIVALVEWTVVAWANRASASVDFNEGVRDRFLLPLELPILAALGLGLMIASFSRIMLNAEPNVGTVLFISIAALILVFGFVFAAWKRPRRVLGAALCALGAVLLVGGGIWAAAHGEHPDLAEEGRLFRDSEEHGPAVRSECGEDPNEADENASSSLSAKAALFARITLRDGTLTATDQDGRPIDPLTVPRGLVTNVMFRNESGDSEHRRLAVHYLAPVIDENGQPTNELAEAVACTNAIESGAVQMLTFSIPRPSAAAPEGRGYTMNVPGVEGAEIEVVVP
jgi:hypothetical protein